MDLVIFCTALAVKERPIALTFLIKMPGFGGLLVSKKSEWPSGVDA
jgi:hypothetical protein